MHATILDDLKKTRKLEADKIPKGNSKSDLLRARNLRRYINQVKRRVRIKIGRIIVSLDNLKQFQHKSCEFQLV